MALALLCAALAAPPALAGQRWTADEAAAWGAVERAWSDLHAEDVDGFISAFHPEFVGWSTARPTPYDLAAEREGTTAFLARYDWERYEIEPVAVRVVDDVAVIHYRYTEALRESGGAGGYEESGHATQVLLRVDGRWLILTTMAGSAQP